MFLFLFFLLLYHRLVHWNVNVCKRHGFLDTGANKLYTTFFSTLFKWDKNGTAFTRAFEELNCVKIVTNFWNRNSQDSHKNQYSGPVWITFTEAQYSDIVGQLSTSILHKMLKLWDIGLSLINFADMPHIVAFQRWLSLTLRVSHGSKIETCSDFSLNSVKVFVLS